MAEEANLIQKLDQWVLEQACRQVSAWRAQNLWGTQQTVAVNISAKQLANKDVPQLVATVLERNGIGRGHLEIELTESNMLVNPELAIASRHALTNMGVRAAIDDFGTGYSSLSYLKSLPVHTIKIDQSFIRDIGENAISEAIIVATVGLAHTIGLTVIAEGVETSKQSEFLLSNRCGTMQGYHFYRPATCEATTALLSELNGGAVARPLTLSPPQVMRCATNAEPGSLTSASHGVASVEASCFG